MLNAAIYIVFAILLIVCALLLLLVLMQRPKQEGLGAAFGAQMTDQAFGAQTTDVLKKGTVLFGSLFMLLCFILSLLMTARAKQKRSDIGTREQAAVTAPASIEAAAEQAAAPAQPDLEKLAAEADVKPAEEVAPAEAPAAAAEQPAETPAQ